MAARVEALITPALLRWCRATAGYDVAAAAAKADVKADALESWEAGDSRPSIPQLRRLAKVYKRPIAVFYLSEPPHGFTLPKDYRRPVGTEAAPPSPALLFQWRAAQARQDLFLELYEQTEGSAPPMTLSASLHEDPEVVAGRIRSFLNVPFEAQEDWRPGRDTMNRWRTAFERAGILVFQMQDVPWREARGFSIDSDLLPVAVVNNKDAENGKIFTMFHELTHLALRQGGICDLRETTGAADDIEVFCNAVAGATLIPRESLLQDDIVRRYPRGFEWTDSDLQRLAQRFHCSSEVVTRRLLVHDRIERAFYQRKREEFAREFTSDLASRQTGPVPPARRTLAKFGQFFVRTALNSYYENNITGSDLADILELRMKHLSKLEQFLDIVKIKGATA